MTEAQMKTFIDALTGTEGAGESSEGHSTGGKVRVFFESLLGLGKLPTLYDFNITVAWVEKLIAADEGGKAPGFEHALKLFENQYTVLSRRLTFAKTLHDLADLISITETELKAVSIFSREGGDSRL